MSVRRFVSTVKADPRTFITYYSWPWPKMVDASWRKEVLEKLKDSGLRKVRFTGPDYYDYEWTFHAVRPAGLSTNSLKRWFNQLVCSHAFAGGTDDICLKCGKYCPKE